MNPTAAIDENQVPAELRERPQWVLWRYETRDGKQTKVPYSVTGARAKADDPATWGTFEQALAVYRSDPQKWAGVGFEFSADDPYCGIDLDAVLDPATGDFLPWPDSFLRKCEFPTIVPSPEKLVELLGSYTEKSPSATGVKVFIKGHLPPGGNRKNADADGNDAKIPGIEMYASGRYFTVTGQRLPSSPSTIAEVNGKLKHLHKFIFGEQAKEKENISQPSKRGKKGRRKKAASSPATADDAFILRKATEAKNGSDFAKLWAGDVSGYPSDSEADLALANHLAFYCGPDPARIESLLRQSGLNRDKWDKHKTYLSDTIAKALEGRTEFYRGPQQTVEDAIEDLAPNEVANGVQVEFTDEEGAIRRKTEALTMAQILQRLEQQTNGWPRAIGNTLFVHDSTHGIAFLDKPADLFGWFQQRVGHVTWCQGPSFVKQGELFSEVRRTSKRYVSIEDLPHEPKMEGHYYACEDTATGDCESLKWLLHRFNPSTDVDFWLMLAAFVTPVWGGPAGCRPVFVPTSDAGRGTGKSTFVEMVGAVYNGALQFSHNEDFATIKTRLLSPDALTKRVALQDNVKTHNYSWGEFEGLVTAHTIGGKRMYVGEASRPNTITWFITLNGASLSTDMAQRSIIIKVDKPERSGTWEEETRQFIETNRKKIIADCVAILREPIEHKLDQFSRWATWERDILQRFPDCNEIQKVILERQGSVDVESEEADIIETHFSEQLERLGYDVDASKVFLPSQLAARWYGWATNQRDTSVISASRMLTQLSTEGRLRRIGVAKGRAGSRGRGFYWTGENWPGTNVDMDVLDRIHSKDPAIRLKGE